MPWTRRAEGGERGLGLGLGRLGAGARARAGVGARPPPRSASRRRPDAQTSTCASAAAAAALQAAPSAARATARANRQSSCTASWPAAARRTRPGPSLGSSSPAPALASSPGSRSQHPPAWVLATQAYPSSVWSIDPNGATSLSAARPPQRAPRRPRTNIHGRHEAGRRTRSRRARTPILQPPVAAARAGARMRQSVDVAHGGGRRGPPHHARRRTYGERRPQTRGFTLLSPPTHRQHRALLGRRSTPSSTMHFCPTCSNLLLLEVRRDSTAGPDACRAPR